MIIVIGAGTAGLSLAIAAAEAGATVQFIEKTNRIGGTLHLSNGMFSAGGTRRQRERGIEDSPDAHFEDVIRISKNTVNRELVRLHCDLAPGMVDWLDDEGFEFRPDCPAILYGHEPYRVPRTYWGVDDGRSILQVLERLIAPHIESGRVKVASEAPAERLIIEGDQVTGVIAGGREWRGDAVVLTTGGYGRNPEMFARFTGGRRLVSYAAESSTGNGLQIGEAAGAAINGHQFFLPSFGGLENPDRPGTVYLPVPDSYNPGARLVPQYREPWEVWVNASGERFVREDDLSVDVRERALLKQLDMRFWIVFDDRVLAQSPPLYSQWPADEIRTLAQEGKLVQRAETLAALARKMEVPADRLQATVEQYNVALEAELPDPLGREHRPLPLTQPPFYAIRQQGIVVRTWAGLVVDTGLRVLRPDRSPIAGLFAVGEALGAHTFSGDSFVGGMSVGPCLALGRHLGARLTRSEFSSEFTL